MPTTLDDVRAARERLAAHIAPSPCAPSIWLDAVVDAEVHLKLESVQPSGSFKDRGALHKLLLLSAEERARGVIAASAGNHAQALALHAKRLGIAATIVMPVTSPLIKIENTRAHGAEVILAGANYDDAHDEARRLESERGLVFVHAFDDDAVIAGQGTMGLEILEQMPELDVLVAPIGGGGLLSGVATAVRALRPQVRIYGVQTELVPGMVAALAAASPVRVSAAQTLADGIAVRQVAGRTCDAIRTLVDDIVLVSEDEIATAVLFLLERQKSLAEGAGAVAVAALLAKKVPDIVGKKVCAVVSGGNIDITMLGHVIDRGLVLAGRFVRLHVRVQDRPGALAEIATVLARLKANVVEIEHERAFTHGPFSEVEVFVTLETRGTEHVAEIRRALEGIAGEVTMRS